MLGDGSHIIMLVRISILCMYNLQCIRSTMQMPARGSAGVIPQVPQYVYARTTMGRTDRQSCLRMCLPSVGTQGYTMQTRNEGGVRCGRTKQRLASLNSGHSSKMNPQTRSATNFPRNCPAAQLSRIRGVAVNNS